MLIQMSTQRPVVNMFALPANVVVLTLMRDGTSNGDLLVDVTGSFENPVPVPHNRQLSLDIPGMAVREFVVPFDQLVQNSRIGAMSGFWFRAQSARRVSAAEYVTQFTEFWVVFPANGGGLVRIGAFDFSNPHLNIHATVPSIGSSWETERDATTQRVSDENLVIAYRRTHAGGSSAAVDRAAAIRANRIANFQLEPVTDGVATLESSRRPDPTPRIQPMAPRPDPTPRYMRDLGLDDG